MLVNMHRPFMAILVTDLAPLDHFVIKGLVDVLADHNDFDPMHELASALKPFVRYHWARPVVDYIAEAVARRKRRFYDEASSPYSTIYEKRSPSLEGKEEPSHIEPCDSLTYAPFTYANRMMPYEEAQSSVISSIESPISEPAQEEAFHNIDVQSMTPLMMVPKNPLMEGEIEEFDPSYFLLDSPRLISNPATPHAEKEIDLHPPRVFYDLGTALTDNRNTPL